jgi:hypothetical protein
MQRLRRALPGSLSRQDARGPEVLARPYLPLRPLVEALVRQAWERVRPRAKQRWPEDASLLAQPPERLLGRPATRATHIRG